MAKETKMKEILKRLQGVVERRDKLQKQGKAFHPDTPKDLQVAIDTFFIHCKNMIDYDLDFIPGEALADLCEVLAKYPKYHHIARDLVHVVNTEYDMTV
tara:strand:- start:55 stop:351 length:297 start_codon:yes stop_codon:yes gene_type:complete